MPTPTKLTLLTMVRLAKQVFDALPPSAANMPPEARLALSQFYDLHEYHGGFAPASAPHIPDDGTI